MSQIIWDYLDNRLSEQERQDFLVRLKNDPLLRQELESCMVLHRNLGQQEWEEPSLGFVHRVMDRLARPARHYQPLVSPKLTRLFWTFVALSFGLTLTLPQLFPAIQVKHTGLPDWLSTVLRNFGQSGNFLIILTVLTTTALVFIALDRWLSQKSRNRTIG